MEDKSYKLLRLLFLKSYLIEVDSNFSALHQQNLLISTKRVFSNYLNYLYFLNSLNPLINVHKFDSNLNSNEVVNFFNAYTNDFFDKKKYYFDLEDLENFNNYYNYKQLILFLEKLSGFIELYYKASINSNIIKKSETPRLVSINNESYKIKVSLSSECVSSRAIVVNKLDYIIQSLVCKFVEPIQIPELVKNLDKFNNLIMKKLNIVYEENSISSNKSVNTNIQISDISYFFNEKVLLINDFESKLKNLIPNYNTKAIDYYIEILNYTRDTEYKNLLLKSNFHNFDEFLMIEKVVNGVILYHDFLKIPYYDIVIKRLQKQNRIIQIDNMTYITLDKFHRDYISRELLSFFYSKIDSFLDLEGFISFKIVCQLFELYTNITLNNKLVIYHLFMNYFPQKKYSIHQYLDSSLYSLKKSKLSKADLIRFYLGDKSYIDFYDTIYEIEEKYGISYPPAMLINDIKGTGFIYNTETEKIYVNKQTFIKEIFKDV